jgi:D-aminopeptidase
VPRVGTLPAGPLDAITDADGVRVGSVTLIEGDAVRTGVTVVVMHDGREPLFAGTHTLNGNGEVTGLEWVRDCTPPSRPPRRRSSTRCWPPRR